MARKKTKKPKVSGKVKTKSIPPHFITAFKKEAQLRASKLIRELAEDLAEEAKDIILEQRYNWESLSSGYLAYKLRVGLDPRILIATGEYVDEGIGHYEKDGIIFVGPMPGIHEPSGVPYVKLARWFEYGTETMPARPLWGPLYRVALKRNKKLRKKIRADTKKAFNEKLKKVTKKKSKKV